MDLRKWFGTRGQVDRSESGSKRLQLTSKEKETSPFTLQFKWPFSVDHVRWPGSGDYSFDNIRKNGSFSSQFDFPALFLFVLENTILLTNDYLELRERLLGLDASSLSVIAALFYKRNQRFTRTDHDLYKDYHVLEKASLCEKCLSGSEVCYNLFTIEELSALVHLPTKYAPKAQWVQACQKSQVVHIPCIRISMCVYEILLRMHQFSFCFFHLEPEDAVCFIQNSKLLCLTQRISLFGLHPYCWEELKLSLDWIRDMASAASTRDDNIYRIFHLAIEAWSNASSCQDDCWMQRKRADNLQRIILWGISCMEKDRKYVEACHYLQSILYAWERKRIVVLEEPNPCTRTSFFMAKVIQRLCVNWGHHLKQEELALSLLERVLLEENLFLFSGDSAQRIGQGSLNRLGGVGMGLILQFQRLSRPPRRWKSRFVYPVRALPERHIVLTKSADINSHQRVEDLTLAYYVKELGFSHGMHCENGILHTLFGVLFLLPPSGLNDFVLHPNPPSILLDIEQRQRTQEIFSKNWQSKHLMQLRGVNWTRNSLEELLFFLDKIGHINIGIICRLFLDAYDAWCGGIGDLLVWDHDRIRFVEVKGPGDSLSDRQIAWGEKLLDCSLDCEVCYVQYK